ncbi:MAG: hypothetical protein DI537_23840 [Stutzerimonas stutzeri]|nr:MAG: hypothetical protein DI537_23840 [Stutzerimonas stutzeri]
MTTIIVCGGRSYGRVPPEPFDYDRAAEQARVERDRLSTIMREAVARLGATRFAMGDATGADCHAARWCKDFGVEFKVYAADWDQHGPQAGPIRNRLMLEQELPSAVIAFPGSKGTRNMCSLAERAGVRVIKVDW